MSANGVETVLSKAMSDAKFADALFADPEKALAGFDLTGEEKSNLKNLSRAEFDALVAAPEERRSFFVINGNNEHENHKAGNHNQSALSVRQ